MVAKQLGIFTPGDISAVGMMRNDDPIAPPQILDDRPHCPGIRFFFIKRRHLFAHGFDQMTFDRRIFPGRGFSVVRTLHRHQQRTRVADRFNQRVNDRLGAPADISERAERRMNFKDHAGADAEFFKLF